MCGSFFTGLRGSSLRFPPIGCCFNNKGWGPQAIRFVSASNDGLTTSDNAVSAYSDLPDVAWPAARSAALWAFCRRPLI